MINSCVEKWAKESPGNRDAVVKTGLALKPFRAVFVSVSESTIGQQLLGGAPVGSVVDLKTECIGMMHFIDAFIAFAEESTKG